MERTELISKIRFVLINDWDPIGIGDNLNLNDEYDGYIGSLVSTLMGKSSIGVIVSFLERIEKEEMRMDNIDIKDLYSIATKLKRIGDEYHLNVTKSTE